MEAPNSPARRNGTAAKGFLSGLYYIVAALLLGFLGGGFLGARVFGSRSGMGWDQLADLLGGVMVGVAVAFLAAAFTVKKLQPKRRIILGSIFIAITALFALVFRATAG